MTRWDARAHAPVFNGTRARGRGRARGARLWASAGAPVASGMLHHLIVFDALRRVTSSNLNVLSAGGRWRPIDIHIPIRIIV